MTKISELNHIENLRQKQSMTDSQRKNAEATKEGVVVNSCIKNTDCSMSEMYDTMVISDNARLPKQIYENKKSKDKSLLPLSAISLGVMGTMAIIAAIARRSAKINLDPATRIPSLTRNLSVNEETHQAIFQMVQCTNYKTILAGSGVLTISAMAFMGKMFLDGFKDVWIKRREADIQKNLQEKLIAVETQSFSGKMQIIRNMLAKKAREFSEFLGESPNVPLAFKNFNAKLAFGSESEAKKTASIKESAKEKRDNQKYLALGLATVASIVALGYLAMSNLRKGKVHIDDFVTVSKTKIKEIVDSAKVENLEDDKKILRSYFLSIDAKPDYISETVDKLPWEETQKASFKKNVIADVLKSTTQANEALGGDGTPKPTFYSHVNDYRAFFYNWLIEKDNKLFQNLFFGIATVSGVSYGGKILGEAIKEVQVKKINANTELELQQRLVSTELRNFKAKKDAAIEPLCDEFYNQVRRGKPKEELKTIAENILYEIKSGPPFVYS